MVMVMVHFSTSTFIPLCLFHYLITYIFPMLCLYVLHLCTVSLLLGVWSQLVITSSNSVECLLNLSVYCMLLNYFFPSLCMCHTYHVIFASLDTVMIESFQSFAVYFTSAQDCKNVLRMYG